jgi:uncharacterized membrane protein YgcG
MKLIKIMFLMFAFALAGCHSANAALPSPSQIATMMDNGDLRGADAALHQVLAVKDTAKVHYMLAQVYLKEGKRPDAQAELARANMMDPYHAYTDNAHYRPVADAIAGRVMPVESHAATPPAVVVVHDSPPANSDNSVKILGILLVFIVVGGVTRYLIDQRKKKDALKDALALVKAKAVSLVSDSERALLNEKTSASPNSQRLDLLNDINLRILNAYDRAKNLVTEDLDTIQQLSTELSDLQSALSSAKNTSPSTKKKEARVADYTNHSPVNQPKTEVPNSTPVNSNTPAAATAATAAPATMTPVIINNTGNNGSSLTDVLIAEELLNSQQRANDDRRREQERQDREDRAREQERRAEEQREADRREREDSWRNSSSSSDSGNDDRWSFSSSSSDSGSNDSWESSSSDSGSSDSW